jgi:uncharacterized protein (DUF362 family)/NAD-dependent dihydropyrimidine dehydrogenase PreA subunit
MSTKVGIVYLKDYCDIPSAITSAIKLIEKDLTFDLLDCKKILIKPNLLRATKDACTQPIFVQGVVNYLKSKGVPSESISIGDSPGQIRTSASKIAKEIGMYEICENEGIQFVDFENYVPVHEIIEDSLRINEYYVSKPVKECDLLINLPKLKTHGEATITGAIKNYWGIIPGGLKAKYHLLGKNPKQFGEALADNYSWVVKNKPKRLIIYDCIQVMQGAMGPVSGPMKTWNLILVGTDELALDIVALKIGRLDGLKNVPHLRSASERGLGEANIKEIEIVGLSLEEARDLAKKFKVPRRSMTRFASFITGRIVYKTTKKIPKLRKKLCRKCGECSEVCPASAIDFQTENYPRYLRNICISCLCCMEICPHQAIRVKARGFFGLFHSY